MRDIWNKGSRDGQLQVYRDGNHRRIDPVSYGSVREQQSYTRTSENEIKNLFPQLPNPDFICMSIRIYLLVANRCRYLVIRQSSHFIVGCSMLSRVSGQGGYNGIGARCIVFFLSG